MDIKQKFHIKDTNHLFILCNLSYMIAFEVFGRPIYRYGLFYLITFVAGYVLLYRLPRSNFFINHAYEYKDLGEMLKKHLDDIFIVLMLGVILGGRLGHVLFYERGYYSQHLLDIFKVNQGGMSFVGGVIGVVIGLWYLTRKYSLDKKALLLFGEFVLLIVPLGSLLGRFGNSLNQELIGKPLADISSSIASGLEYFGLTRVYDTIDTIVRVDTNIIQSLTEGGLLLFLTWGIFFFVYRKKPKIMPGLIAGRYLLSVGSIRFFTEFLKDLPSHEMLGPLSVSQFLALLLMSAGVIVLFLRRKR